MLELLFTLSMSLSAQGQGLCGSLLQEAGITVQPGEIVRIIDDPVAPAAAPSRLLALQEALDSSDLEQRHPRQIAALISSYWSAIGVRHFEIRDTLANRTFLYVIPDDQTPLGRFAKSYLQAHGKMIFIMPEHLLEGTSTRAAFNDARGILISFKDAMEFNARRGNGLRHELRHSKQIANLREGIESDYVGIFERHGAPLFSKDIGHATVRMNSVGIEEFLTYEEDIRRGVSALADVKKFETLFAGHGVAAMSTSKYVNFQFGWEVAGSLDFAGPQFEAIKHFSELALKALRTGRARRAELAYKLDVGSYFEKYGIVFPDENGNDVLFYTYVPQASKASVDGYLIRHLTRVGQNADFHLARWQQANRVLKFLKADLPFPKDLEAWHAKLMTIRTILGARDKALYQRSIR